VMGSATVRQTTALSTDCQRENHNAWRIERFAMTSLTTSSDPMRLASTAVGIIAKTKTNVSGATRSGHAQLR